MQNSLQGGTGNITGRIPDIHDTRIYAIIDEVNKIITDVVHFPMREMNPLVYIWFPERSQSYDIFTVQYKISRTHSNEQCDLKALNKYQCHVRFHYVTHTPDKKYKLMYSSYDINIIDKQFAYTFDPAVLTQQIVNTFEHFDGNINEITSYTTNNNIHITNAENFHRQIEHDILNTYKVCSINGNDEIRLWREYNIKDTDFIIAISVEGAKVYYFIYHRSFTKVNNQIPLVMMNTTEGDVDVKRKHNDIISRIYDMQSCVDYFMEIFNGIDQNIQREYNISIDVLYETNKCNEINQCINFSYYTESECRIKRFLFNMNDQNIEKYNSIVNKNMDSDKEMFFVTSVIEDIKNILTKPSSHAIPQRRQINIQPMYDHLKGKNDNMLMYDDFDLIMGIYSRSDPVFGPLVQTAESRLPSGEITETEDVSPQPSPRPILPFKRPFSSTENLKGLKAHYIERLVDILLQPLPRPKHCLVTASPL